MKRKTPKCIFFTIFGVVEMKEVSMFQQCMDFFFFKAAFIRVERVTELYYYQFVGNV